MKHRWRGKYWEDAKGGYVCHSHESSFTTHKAQRNVPARGESNERCVDDSDEREPPLNQIKVSHAIDLAPKRKMKTMNKGSQGQDIMKVDVDEMEVDGTSGIPTWEAP